MAGQRRIMGMHTPPAVRAAAYVLLFSGVVIALVVGVAASAILIAHLEGTFQNLPSISQLRGH